VTMLVGDYRLGPSSGSGAVITGQVIGVDGGSRL
jgi:hypothetical protein